MHSVKLKVNKYILPGKHRGDTLCSCICIPFFQNSTEREEGKTLLSCVLKFLCEELLSDTPKTLLLLLFFPPPKGFLIYFAYGIRHSLEGNPRDEEDDEDAYSDNINSAAEEKSAIQANDHHQRNLSLPFIFHEKTSEC